MELDSITCDFCKKTVSGVIKLKIFSEGLWTCEPCYSQIKAAQATPYSKIMDRFAMQEAGYYANRKKANIKRYMAGIR